MIIDENTSESSDESDYEEIINILEEQLRVNVPKVHCKNYIENIVHQYTDFKNYFW